MRLQDDARLRPGLTATPSGCVLCLVEPTNRRPGEWRAAILKIGVAALLASGIYFGYRHYVQIRRDVAVLIDGPGGRGGGARSEMAKDTPAGWLRAEKLLEEVLRIHPRNAFGIIALADVETQLVAAGYADRAARAEEARRKADAKGLPFAELFDAHALSMLQAGKAAQAEAYARSLLEKYPALPAVPRFHDLLGRAQRAQGKLAEAKASFKRAQDADWRQPRFVADYAEALLDDGDAAGALAAFDRALQASSGHLRSQIGKARAQTALARQGHSDTKAARALLDELLRNPEQELTPELRAGALAARAEARLAGQDAAGAGEDAAAAVAIAPRLAAALRARAMVDAAARRPSAAPEFEAAIAADPVNPSTYLDGAEALESAGDLAGADKLLGAYASALQPSARFHATRARLLARRGDAAGARAEAAKAAALEPANALAYQQQIQVVQRARAR
jgi:predicted Zn-dependent protease